MPGGGRVKRASRDPAEQSRQRRVQLVGMDRMRHTEHVRDVFRSSASGAWSCLCGVVQACDGPIQVLTREVPAPDRCWPVLRD